MEEIWKEIPGYPMYRVSNLGNIKHIETTQYRHGKKQSFWYHHPEKILSPRIGTNGYTRVTLREDGKSKDFSIHRLVAKAFIENIDSRPCVNHKNGDKTDNRVSNLEWCTYQENVHHAIDTGLFDHKKTSLLGARKVSRAVQSYDPNSGEKLKYESSLEAMRKTGIYYRTILSCCHGEKYHKTAGGLIWNFI